jgi:hypothetical protein
VQPTCTPSTKKAPAGQACPYPKLKRPSGHAAGRAFLRGCLADLPLFKRGQPAKKGFDVTSEKLEKDLGKDKPIRRGFFVNESFPKAQLLSISTL